MDMDRCPNCHARTWNPLQGGFCTQCGYGMGDQLRAKYGMTRTPAVATDEQGMLRGALETCAKTFRRYGELHRMKGTAEGNLKASNNDDLAEFCEGVLADTIPVQPSSVATDEGVVERVARAMLAHDELHDELFCLTGEPERVASDFARAAILAIQEGVGEHE